MRNRFYTEEEKKFLKENIDKFGVEICSEKIERSQRSVTSLCYREFGHCCFVCHASKKEIDSLVFKNKRKILSIDFNETNSPKELAYFLGYFWADGYIRNDKSLVMEIIKEDADDIEHILMTLADFTIYERTRPNKKTQKTFFYKGCDDEIADKLISMGKFPKSLKSHKEIIKYIPSCYVNYFIRGLIDGDGNLYISPATSKHHSTQITIAGRSGQDWDYLIDFVKSNYNINFRMQNRSYKSYKSSVIRATDKSKIINFLGKIYEKDDKIYLTRKYNKIKTLLEN